ncbi:fatty acid CoA ligase family protein [Algoriphagus sp. AK58]|uniref:fatty acid CoA ligase family protein n=1 Tax=Algoriphagus sp. AK58 TaxID=1406877 RepID=UPI00164FE033|nr:fatty acid CoA ligase family protein [Algoriphagus sp. AK58]MBC6366470.1 peptide synthase [Algoriphagus sp. AK58]
MESFNLTAALFERAKTHPDLLAIAFPKRNSLDKNGITQYQKISFKELAQQTAQVGRGLLEAGFQRGDKVVLMVPPGFNFFTLSFGMLQTGIIPVFIDPGTGLRNLKKCISEVDPEGFIGIPMAHLARVIFGWGKKSIHKTVTIGPRLFWGGKSFNSIHKSYQNDQERPFFDARSEDIAAIIFTSGSTGVPKGVVYTHGNFKAQLDIIRSTFDFSPGEIDMPTFPPFALFNPGLGMSSIIPDMNPSKPAKVNPCHIIGPVIQFGITNLFGSPALIDAVGRYGKAHGIKLPTLKRVISAGGPASNKALMRFSSMLNPETQIFTPYGATESMPLTKIGSHEILGEKKEKTENGAGICVGKPLKSVEIAIIKISDEEIPEWSDDLKLPLGEVGEIVAKGPNVTRSYFNREQSNRLAKIKDGSEIRHRMGDLGYLDEEGNLWFCGRKSHRVVTDDQVLFSVQCEQIFNKHPQVFRTALVGVEKKAVLCVETEKNLKSIDLDRLKRELLSLAQKKPITRPVKVVLFHPEFPVDFRHNTKIAREQLADWAKMKLK